MRGIVLRFGEAIAIRLSSKLGLVSTCTLLSASQTWIAIGSPHRVLSSITAAAMALSAAYFFVTPGVTVARSRAAYAAMSSGERLQRSVVVLVVACAVAIVLGLWVFESASNARVRGERFDRVHATF